MNRRVVVAIGVVTLAVSGLGACTKDSGGTLSRDEFISQMTSGDEAIPNDVATCIADAVEAQGIKIDKDGNPSKDQEDEATSIAMKCFGDVNNIDPSQLEGLTSTTTAAP